jgi:predicted  nucleic acid-binding Zn-ribbon protein
MQEFKSPVTRLARLFHKGRDNWREKALEKQSKVRSLEIRIRDLTNSRSNWKARALAAEKKLKSLDVEGGLAEKKQESHRKKTT